jgi:nitrate/TMAO reductase-like tetraheme cytochrome c subunit
MEDGMGSLWRSSRDPEQGARPRKAVASALPTILALLLCAAAWGRASAAEENSDSCVECHSDSELVVTDKKLYDYFLRWGSSIHKQEGVSCADCHGGNPGVSDKRGAHGGDLGGAEAKSAVNFRNISDTCGDCHDDIFEGFSNSEHFQRISSEKEDGDQQGPTCVTCHGSINVAVLNVTTVEGICEQCHHEDSDNQPETPRKARALLNRFLSIHRYYRYITVRGDPVETKPFFERIDAQIRDLTVTWHSFDLVAIEKKTEGVLQELKAKREQVAFDYKQDLEKRRQRSD